MGKRGGGIPPIGKKSQKKVFESLLCFVEKIKESKEIRNLVLCLVKRAASWQPWGQFEGASATFQLLRHMSLCTAAPGGDKYNWGWKYKCVNI